jgi:hypothetical protein
MKVKLRTHKDGAALYEASYEVVDADSFGRTCTDVWTQLRDRRLASATSIGVLFDELDERLIEELFGADISLSKA